VSSKEVPPSSRRPRYSAEFKADAVDMVIESERSVAEVARGSGWSSRR
jgi:transposase-like protein